MEYKYGDIINVEISGITDYGIFVKADSGYTGLIHISEVSNQYIRNLKGLYKVGTFINALILEVDPLKAHLKLSIKRINYDKRIDISKIPESANKFAAIEENLPNWIDTKYNEIINQRKASSSGEKNNFKG